MTTGPSDDSIMLVVVHDALRRDADHLARSVERRDLEDPGRRAGFLTGWEIFKRQLRRHHDSEDRDLWPLARTYLPARDEENVLLNEMEDEHARIAPLVAAVDTALATSDAGWLAEATVTFRAELLAHLSHEERATLPMLESVLSGQDWKAFARAQRRSTGYRAREFFPYILHEADPERAARVSRRLAPPLRLMVGRVWQPRYASIARWEHPVP